MRSGPSAARIRVAHDDPAPASRFCNPSRLRRRLFDLRLFRLGFLGLRLFRRRALWSRFRNAEELAAAAAGAAAQFLVARMRRLLRRLGRQFRGFRLSASPGTMVARSDRPMLARGN
jgi:hypothetical protein